MRLRNLILTIFLVVSPSSAEFVSSAELVTKSDTRLIETRRYEAYLYATGRITHHRTGVRIVFVQFPNNSPEHVEFCVKLLRMSVGQYELTRRQCEQLGRCPPAIVVKTWYEMIDKVSTTPGAVGYLEQFKVEYEEAGVARVTILD